ncbi:MAG: S8 family serine peptidase [Planctomycetota bacterium]
MLSNSTRGANSLALSISVPMDHRPRLRARRSGIGATLGLLVLAVLAFGVSPLAGSELSDDIILQRVAESHGLATAELEVADRHTRVLATTGMTLTRAKVIAPASGRIFAVALDSEGRVVDAARCLRQEEVAYRERFGALHPDLLDPLTALADSDRIAIGIWLRSDTLEFPRRDEFMDKESPTREQVRAFRRACLERVAPQLAELGAPLLARLAAIGEEPTYVSSVAPLVYVTVAKSTVLELARRLDIDTIYGPNQNRDALDVAKPTVKADLVDTWDFQGSGVFLGILEDSRVAFNSPHLAAGVTRVPAHPNVDDHATQTAGIVASTESTYQGLAQQASLYSANATDYLDPNIAAAIDWTVTENLDVINHSWSSNAGSGNLNDHDRHLDYNSRAYADSHVAAAGNEGGSCGAGWVTSPGKGFNVITVGNLDDGGTVTWDDDTVYECSSYRDPATGAEKPEVVAPGVAITSTTASSPWTGAGTGTSFSAPMVSALIADIINGNGNAGGYPEAAKAVVMATAVHNVEGNSRLSDFDGAGAIDGRAAIVTAVEAHIEGISVIPSELPLIRDFTLRQGSRTRVVACWNSNPNGSYTVDPLEVDLDLVVEGPDGVIVASSTSVNNPFEIVDFVPTVTGVHRVRVIDMVYPGGIEYLGLALWSGSDVLDADVPVTQVASEIPLDHLEFRPAAGWNVVAMQGQTGLNHNLTLFEASPWEDPADYVVWEQSTLAAGFLDFVVVDRNHLGQGARFVEVREAGASGDRTVEHAESREDILVGDYGPYAFGPDGLVEVFDLQLLAGNRKHVRVVPVSGSPDLGVFLFDSDPNDPATWAQRRTDNLVTANSGVSGEPEAFDYQASVADRHGLVVANLAGPGGGMFRLFADTTGPDATIFINDDAPQTGSQRVRVEVVTTDLETGIRRLRVRETGGPWIDVFDAVIGPSSLQRVLELDLSSGPGAHVVEAEVQNNAGIVTTVADVIAVYGCPQAPGLLTNGEFEDVTGFPWCFYDFSASGFVSYTNGRARVRGGDDPAVAATATYIGQAFALTAVGQHELEFSWEFQSDETGSGMDGAAWDLLDLATGASVVGGPQILSTTAGESGVVTLAMLGPGSFELRLGVLSNNGQTGPGFGIFDAVTVVPTLVESEFKRGDCNSDGALQITDVVFCLEALFGPALPTCRDACDSNDDGAFQIVDAVYTANYLFAGGAPPPPPLGVCGSDPTADSLHCMSAPCP